MQDITDRLDAELRTPPPPTFDVAATVGAGRRAVRRQRLVRAGAALALALVLGATGLAVTSQFGGTQLDRSVQVAAGVSAEGLAPTKGLVDDFPAGYDPQHDDVVLVRDGWEVVERVEDPVTGLVSKNENETVTDSVALSLREGEDTVWVVLWRFERSGDTPGGQGGGGVSDDTTQAGFDTLATWIAHQRSLTFTQDAL